MESFIRVRLERSTRNLCFVCDELNSFYSSILSFLALGSFYTWAFLFQRLFYSKTRWNNQWIDQKSESEFDPHQTCDADDDNGIWFDLKYDSTLHFFIIIYPFFFLLFWPKNFLTFFPLEDLNQKEISIKFGGVELRVMESWRGRIFFRHYSICNL